MPTKKQSAASFAAEAQRQFNELRSALQAARASLASISRSIRPENIKIPRHRIPRSTSGGISELEGLGASIFAAAVNYQIDPNTVTKLNATVAGAKLSSSFTGDALTSFRVSSGQASAQILDAALRGQRTR